MEAPREYGVDGCGVFAVVYYLHAMTHTKLPELVNALLWRGVHAGDLQPYATLMTASLSLVLRVHASPSSPRALRVSKYPGSHPRPDGGI